MDTCKNNDMRGKGVQPNAPTGGKRRSIRLQGYDYSCQGAYFVTICTHDKLHLFGKIRDGRMQLSDFGRIVQVEWEKSTIIRQEIELGEYVVMPNHFHGIVFITNSRGVRPNAPTGLKPRSLGSMISGFKAAVTVQMRNRGYQTEVWQRNYYEHIIRNEHDYLSIAEYITDNPSNWAKDSLNQDKAQSEESLEHCYTLHGSTRVS